MRLRSLFSRPAGAALGVLLLLASTACAANKRVAYAPHELKTEVAGRVPAERIADIVVPFQPTQDLVARAETYTRGPTSEHGRANLLLRAVTDESQFGITYEPVATTLPAATVESRIGNCLSMTSLYIGLARALGLSAYYVDASDRVNDISRQDALIVDTGHIAATVRTERGWSMVDFTGEITNYRTFRVIDDVEALAHFYNNRGYETITAAEGDESQAAAWTSARRDFQMATLVLPNFARAQNNLGVAASRLGDPAGAEAAYLAASTADEDFAAPRHNLGNLFLRRGEFERAIHWYTLAIELQKNNPFAHYHLGLARYQAGDLPGSIAAFERAIKLKHDYKEPRNLLAQAYRAEGRHEDADRVVRANGQR